MNDYYAGGRGFCGDERCLASSGSFGHQQGTRGLPAQGLISIMETFLVAMLKSTTLFDDNYSEVDDDHDYDYDGDVVQDKKVLVAGPDVLSFSVVDHKMQFAGACHRRHRRHRHHHRHHHYVSPSSSNIILLKFVPYFLIIAVHFDPLLCYHCHNHHHHHHHEYHE